MTVEPSGFNDESDMGFTWNMTKFTDEYFELQVKFNQPKLFARSNEDDILVVKILNETWFVDKQSFLFLDQDSKKLTRVIPR